MGVNAVLRRCYGRPGTPGKDGPKINATNLQTELIDPDLLGSEDFNTEYRPRNRPDPSPSGRGDICPRI